MKFVRFLMVLLFCLLQLTVALAGEDYAGLPDESRSFHIQDGVIYFLDGETARVVDFLKDEEEITIHAYIGDLPVNCDPISISQGLVRQITSEKGVEGIDSIHLEDCPNLICVEMQTVQFMKSYVYEGEDIYLLDCPKLTSFKIHENIGDVDMEFNIAHCPRLVVDVPKMEDDIDTDSFIFKGEEHLNQEVCIVPEGAVYAEINSQEITSIVLPSTLEWLDIDAPNLLTIELSVLNQHMYLLDGVLYYEEPWRGLTAYPSGRKDTSYTIRPDAHVYPINSNYLEKVTLPDTFDGFIKYLDGCPNLRILELPLTYSHSYIEYEEMLEEHLFINDTYLYEYKDGWKNDNLRLTVAPGHESLCIQDGMLYTIDGEELLFAPPNRHGALTVPEGTKKIAPYAFYGSAITQLSLPASLEPLSSAKAFFGLTDLAAITVDPSNLFYQSIDGVLYSKDGKTMVARPANHGEVYTVCAGTESIAPYAFMPNQSLQIVHMPPSVTSVGWAAFYNNLALRRISLSNQITEIGEYAFENCLQLEKLVLPSELSYVPDIIGFDEAQERRWYEADNPIRTNQVARMEIWIPGTITHFSNSAFNYIKGYTGRMPCELLLVVEQGSPGHAYAIAQGLPYCFPEEVALARTGYQYALVCGGVGETIPIYSAPDKTSAIGSLHEGTALLLLGEQDGWICGKNGTESVYVESEKCRIISEQIINHYYRIYKAATSVSILEYPMPDAQKLEDLQEGVELRAVRQFGPWLRVISDSLCEGYILKKDLLHSTHYLQVQLPAISAMALVYETPVQGAPIIKKLNNGETFYNYNDYISDDGWCYTNEGFMRIDDLVGYE